MSATGPSYHTFSRSVISARPIAGSPASSASVACPARRVSSRAASTATPGVGVENSTLKSWSSVATLGASRGRARRTTVTTLAGCSRRGSGGGARRSRRSDGGWRGRADVLGRRGAILYEVARPDEHDAQYGRGERGDRGDEQHVVQRVDECGARGEGRAGPQAFGRRGERLGGAPLADGVCQRVGVRGERAAAQRRV